MVANVTTNPLGGDEARAVPFTYGSLPGEAFYFVAKEAPPM